MPPCFLLRLGRGLMSKPGRHAGHGLPPRGRLCAAAAAPACPAASPLLLGSSAPASPWGQMRMS